MCVCVSLHIDLVVMCARSVIFGFCGSFSYQIKRCMERQGHHLFTSLRRNIRTPCVVISSCGQEFILQYTWNSKSSDNLFIKIPIQYSYKLWLSHSRTDAYPHNIHIWPKIYIFNKTHSMTEERNELTAFSKCVCIAVVKERYGKWCIG